MNSRLSEKSLKKLAEPAYQALIYDSTRTDWDATDPGQTFAPRHSRGERHLGNLVYADGHAKLVSVDDFTKAVQ